MPVLAKYCKYLSVVSLFFFIVPCGFLAAQCPLTADAGPDQTACAPNGIATLQGNVIGDFLGFNWSPPTGLDDPTSLTPTADVSGTLTYTLTASALDPTAVNMVNNPAFEMGSIGYFSSLIENPLPITPGTYVLTTSPAAVNSNFPPCDDHTFGNGTGFLMLVNGPAVGGTQVWCQTIPVNPNTWYSMSAWVTSSPISPPELQFSANGQMLGNPYLVETTPCNWQQFSEAWFSGPAASVEICIVDQNGSGNGLFGDDFSLDDIFFGEACSVSDEVTVSLADAAAVAEPLATLLCSDLPAGLMLNGTGSSAGPNISYLWTTPDGTIVSGENTLMPIITAPGTYTLTVTYDDGSALCIEEASTLVIEDPNTVFAFIAPPDELSCENPSVILDAGGSSSGPTISYQWSPSANIVTGGDGLTPEVDAEGTYTLTVTNSISGCTTEETVDVFGNFSTPQAMAATEGELTCATTSVGLNGTGSSIGNNFDYEWTSNEGNILSGETTLNGAIAGAPGEYFLTVTDTQNGCTAADTVIVVADTVPPVAVASAPLPIGCGGGSVSLSGSGSSGGAGIEYLWTTTDGNLLNGQTTLTPTADAPGEYHLMVTDTDNGCTASDTTFLSENTASLTVSIALPDTLNCLLTSLVLDATASTQNMDVTNAWTTSDGNLAAGQNTLTPTVDAPGTYVLTLTDGPTGCTATALVMVSENTAPPTAEAGPLAAIDCDAEPVELNGSGTVGQYQWLTPNGNLLSGETTLTPVVNAAGIYFLTITDPSNGCTATDSTTVSQVGNAPVVNLIVDDTLDCTTELLTIDGSGSTTAPQILIAWSTADGNLAAGQNTLTPTVDAAGTYVLTLTDQSSGCIGSGNVTVAIDTVPPVAEIAPSPGLDCLAETDTLDATASSQGALFVYAWNSLGGGQILSGANSLEPTVGSAGVYVLTVVSWENGCVQTDTVVVAEDADPPMAEAGTPQTLTCDVDTLALDGNGSSTGSSFTYFWMTTDGNIVAGETGLAPTIDAPGTYFLMVENTANGCTATDSVMVGESADLPTAIIALPDTIDCTAPSVVLNGNGSSAGVDYTYIWTTQNGSFAGGVPPLMPEVDAPGTYTLIVTDTTNNCSATESVTVWGDGDLPVAEAGLPFTLSCLLPEANLNGNGSSAGNEFSYEWTTVSGNILSDEITLTPTINAPGEYLLTVTDGSNGCTATDSVSITQDAAAPVADAGTNISLTCVDTLLTLDGSSSSIENVVYEWSTTTGNIVEGGNSLSPLVDMAGNYLLTVTDTVNNCQSVDGVTVMDFYDVPEISTTVNEELNCENDSVLVSGAVIWMSPLLVSPVPSWFTMDGDILVPPSSNGVQVGDPGTYVFVVTNALNGCTVSETVEVLENLAAPEITIEPLPALACGQSEVTLEAAVTGAGVNFLPTWEAVEGGVIGGVSSLTPTVEAPGIYELTVVDESNGCSSVEVVTVAGGGASPEAIITPPGLLTCVDTLVMLDGGLSVLTLDFNLSWQTLDGNLAAGQNSLMPTVDEPGVYLLILENTLNGCADTAVVTVGESILPPGAEAGPDTLLTCAEPVVSLGGASPAPGAEFRWATPNGNILSGGGSAAPEVDAAGAYLLTVTDLVNGCTSVDTAEVVAAFLEDFFYENTDANCVTGEGSINIQWVVGGIGPYAYSIDGGENYGPQALFENLPPGTYNVAVEDAGGCLLTDVVIITEATGVEVLLPQIVNLDLGETSQLTPGLNLSDDEIAEVEWSPAAGLSCTDCLNPIAAPTEDVTYLLTVTDVNGCMSTAAIGFVLASPNEAVYVPNAFSPNGDGLNDALVVFAQPSAVRQVSRFLVFTRWGESVFEAYNFPVGEVAQGWDGTHRGEELGAGVYVWFAEVEMINGEKRFLEGEVNLLK